MKIVKSIIDLVGYTPTVELVRLEKKYGLKARLCAKLEYFNPAGSAKDRIAKAMILDAIQKGKIDRDSVIIEPTSGNTGIGLAFVCGTFGMRTILTMPDTMSKERQDLLKAYGAEIVLTDGKLGMKGAIDKANELAASIPNSYIPGQFTNPVNPKAHFETTGPEIWKDTEEKVDIFVAGVGTGGTLSGTGKYLKKMNPNIKVVAVEPEKSPLLSGGQAAPHGLQGIGANFIPETLDKNIIDEVITVGDEEAYAQTKELSEEGILVGISSGAAVVAAKKLAQRPENEGKLIVTLLPDNGERYISTGVFA
ncbi:MAG: cysteine synthase A [Spirochaetaceae bacterium]|nr:cysteine synthase A [Spirochaetaceae bacterium]MBQ4555382.1 cysteine synthase A [Spirochaetaceae bacterium]